MKHVIIGNSAAGISAVETLRSLDQGAEITIIDRETSEAYSRCLLPGLLSGEVREKNIRFRPADFYMEKRLKKVFGAAVEVVNPGNREVVLGDGQKIPYDRLLIATGADTYTPPIPGLKGEGIFGLRHLQDARGILGAIQGARRAVVMGGGLVGLEAAYALYRRGVEVTVVEKMSQIMPQQFDQRAAAILQRDMQAEGIRFIIGQGVKEVLGPNLWQRFFAGNGRGVVLEDGQHLKAELVIVATGTRANIRFLQGSGIAVNRGIYVNRYQETNIPGIFAAGDVAESLDPETGEHMLTPIWPNAVVQGRTAAYNMAGQSRVVSPILGVQNAVEFREVPAIAMGYVSPQQAGYEVLSEYRPRDRYYRKLVLKDDVLVGAILVGVIAHAGVYAALIKNKTNLGKVKHRLLSPDFAYATMLAG